MKLFQQIIAVFLLFLYEGSANPVIKPSLETSSNIQKDAATSNCPTGYSQPANSNWPYCYMVHTSLLNRNDAAAQCNTDNGTLASVGNAFVNSYIYTLATQEGSEALWIGIECFNANLSNCVNDDNTKAVYTNFLPGQPDKYQWCILMYTGGTTYWASNFCKNQLQFVCEVPAGSYAQTRCLHGWTEFQGLCYKKFQTDGGISRNGASEQCLEAKGGILASIHSKEVNDFITSMSCDNTITRIGLQCPNAPKKGDTSTCVWDDGTLFNYSNFAEGEPIRSANKFCGSIHNGTWYAHDKCDGLFNCNACQAPMLNN